MIIINLYIVNLRVHLVIPVHSQKPVMFISLWEREREREREKGELTT